MLLDELRSNLADASRHEPAADVALGRRGVDRLVRRHHVRTTGTVVVAVVAVLAAFGLGLGHTGTGDPLPVLSGPSSARHLLPAAAPTGFTFDHAVALPDAGTAGLPLAHPGRTFVYSDTTGAGALDGTTFAVSLLWFDQSVLQQRAAVGGTSDGTAPGSLPRTGVSRAEIDPATFRWASIFGAEVADVLGPHRAVRSDAGADWLAFVYSRTVDEETLQRVADSLRPNAEGTALDAIALPDGYSLATSSSSFGVAETSASLLVSLVSDPATLITFTDDFSANPPRARRSAFVALAEVPDHAADLDTIGWFLQGEVPVVVHGRPGIAGTFVSGRATTSTGTGTAIGDDGQPLPEQPPGSTITTRYELSQSVLAWTEADGRLVVVQSEGASTVELERFAAGLRDVDDVTWHRFRMAPTTLPPNCQANEAGGRTCTFDGGTGSSIAGPTTTIR